MPAFTRRPQPESKFIVRGMTLAVPPDQIPPQKFSYLQNIRSPQDGQIVTRPGLTLISNSFGAASYLHSLIRVTDSNPDTLVGWFRLVGTDLGEVYLGQDDAGFLAGFNPVLTGLSGAPLALIPLRPAQMSSAAVYVGDSGRMAEIFFRPQDDLATGPFVGQVGLPPPNGVVGGVGGLGLPLPAIAGGAGNLDGTYWWRFRSRNIYTGKTSNPSAPTRQDITPDPVFPALQTGLALANQNATMTLPTLSAQSIGLEADVTVDVYRFGGTVFDWHLVGSGDPGTTFTDSLADIDVLSAPSFPVDAVGQPGQVQPFATLDITRQGGVVLSGGGAAPVIATFGPGDIPAQNLAAYPPGTAVIVDVGSNPQVMHFYRFADGPTTVELVEDIPAVLGTGVSYAFQILSPVMVGQPLGRLWGPFGAGESGVYLFACGDARNPGTLYWTNANDPDAAALTNSLEVTDPSEPLINGLVWDGRNYLWSDKRMFEVLPDLGTPGNFLARQIPNAGGLWAPWAIADCGSFMAYVGYDGIYLSQGVGSESFTADLLPWFPHDASPGIEFTRGGQVIPVGDPEQLDKWRLAWQDGILYFDFPPRAS